MVWKFGWMWRFLNHHDYVENIWINLLCMVRERYNESVYNETQVTFGIVSTEAFSEITNVLDYGFWISLYSILETVTSIKKKKKFWVCCWGLIRELLDKYIICIGISSRLWLCLVLSVFVQNSGKYDLLWDLKICVYKDLLLGNKTLVLKIAGQLWKYFLMVTWFHWFYGVLQIVYTKW